MVEDIYKYPWEKNIGKPSRYLASDETGSLDASLTVSPPGFCNWCGKPVPRKNQRFCPGVITYEYTFTDGAGKKHTARDRRYYCTLAFIEYWTRIPRFPFTQSWLLEDK